MKLGQRDIAKLIWHVSACLGAIAVAVVVALATQNVMLKARSTRDSAASRQSAIEQRLALVRTEEQDIKSRTVAFQQMDASGIIGPEKRLDWTETLRDLQKQLRIPGMNYEFGAQVALEGSGTTTAPQYYRSSQLKIELKLLHEGDLINFITRLQQEAKALVLLRSCKVTRLTTSGTDFAQLAAECTMDWITLRNPGGVKQP